MTHLMPFYKTLKFTDATASLDDVKKRYKQLALLFHPDKATSEEEKKTFTAAFTELKDAYDIIVKHLKKTLNSTKASDTTTSPPVASKERKQNKDSSKQKDKAGKQDFYDSVLGNGKQKGNTSGAQSDSKSSSDIREAYAKFMGGAETNTNAKEKGTPLGPRPVGPRPFTASTASKATPSSFLPNARFKTGSASSSGFGSGPPPFRAAPMQSQAFPSPSNGPWSFADSDPLSNRHSHSHVNGNTANGSSSQDKKTGYERNTKRETYRILELSLRDFMCGAIRKIPSNKGGRCRVCFSESGPITMCTTCNGRGPRCSGCEGSGTKKGFQFSICNHCGGQGKMIDCGRCSNRGYCLGNCIKCCNTRGVPAPDTITINIVPGKHFPGTILRLVDGHRAFGSEYGHSSVRDIVLRLVNIGDLLEGGNIFGDGIPRPLFKTAGPVNLGDLTCTLPIQLNGILLGCQLEFHHMNGLVFRVNTPEGHIMSPNEYLIMEGQGIPRPGGGRGRLYIALKWQMPTPGDVELMRESLQHLLPIVSKPRDRNGVIATIRSELLPVEAVETILNEREIVIDVSVR